MAFPNIFTEKTVGIAFAAAFALWAWYLNSLAGTVMEGVREIRSEQKEVQIQMQAVRADIVQHQIYAAQAGAEFREQIKNMDRRLQIIEEEHHVLRSRGVER